MSRVVRLMSWWWRWWTGWWTRRGVLLMVGGNVGSWRWGGPCASSKMSMWIQKDVIACDVSSIHGNILHCSTPLSTSAILSTLMSHWTLLGHFRHFCLPDPGVPGVQSMGPGVSNYIHSYDTLVKVCWCDSGWWWYQLNTSWWCQ